jgi:carbon storage regulator
MLVLTRKLGESVCVGQDVEVFVVGVSRGRVKLGFRAPREMPVQRSEVADRIQSAESVERDHEAIISLPIHRKSQTTPPLRGFRQLEIAEVQQVH